MNQDSKVTSLDTPTPANKGLAAAASAIVAAKVKASSSGNSELSGATSKIKIFAGTEESGNHAVFVSQNGIAFLIPRDQVVDVPVELIEILSNAITTITATAPNGIGVTTRDVPRYNFQNVV